MLLYEAGAYLFLGVLGQPRTGLLLTGPALVLLPLFSTLRAARVPAAEAVRWTPAAPAVFPAAVLGVVAALPPVLFVVTRFVETPARVEEFFSDLLSARSPADFAVVVIAAAIVPALTEEILFRGFLQRSLEARLGRWSGILLSAAAFGVIHGPTRAPTAFLLGAMLGWIASRTGSVLPSVLAHVAVNTIAVSIVNSSGFATGQGWPETLPVPALLIWAAISAASFAVVARMTERRAGAP